MWLARSASGVGCGKTPGKGCMLAIEQDHPRTMNSESLKSYLHPSLPPPRAGLISPSVEYPQLGRVPKQKSVFSHRILHPCRQTPKQPHTLTLNRALGHGIPTLTGPGSSLDLTTGDSRAGFEEAQLSNEGLGTSAAVPA